MQHGREERADGLHGSAIKTRGRSGGVMGARTARINARASAAKGPVSAPRP